MSIEITMIVLLAAIFNASWNAIVKVSGDRIAVMAVITLLGSLVSVFALPFVVIPDPASWPLLGLAILIHTAYHFCLPMAYHYGDFGQIYPIARGSAPLLVTLGAAAFAGEMLGFLPLLGVLFLGVGVMSLSFDTSTGITRNPRAILLALGTGALIASYTLVGGLGARQAGSVFGFAVLLTLGNGLLTFAIALTWKSKEIKRVISSNLAPAIVGGGMQVGAYWIVIWAMAYAPLGMVSALRETSVLFAALISTIILKEGFGVWRFVSSGLIACGVTLTRYKP
ncbi:EamA family transporter [Vreelandella titanicae]|jgi:drug/metabolite transporter (DMT)-like permease|uniref:EamA family transporter n=1 Tax=Vreelandella titanicae TaxID=664683 RepID=UPI00034809BE|nr:EamA family transporter [Halomonas titanicae]NVE90085.1 EamA family transporter [Halomonas titanicae]|tara:strand:+ start:5641 stop:6486 length:846 start_codon:yes stop_codon:yes gene_type:complete